MAESTNIAAECQALPLEYIVTAPLTAAVKAQRAAAEATHDFITGMIGEDGKPRTVDFSVDNTVGDTTNTVAIKAPLLSIVPVPHLRIDSLKIQFQFEITQTLRDSSETSKSLEVGAKTGGLLSAWVSATLKGSVSSKSSSESTMNRSGQLEVTLNASESQMPEGLAKILTLMSRAVDVPDTTE